MKKELQRLATTTRINVAAARRLLFGFSDKLVQEKGLQVPRHDPRFYPKRTTVSNTLVRARQGGRLDPCDQEAVKLFIGEEKQRSPDSFWFFEESGPGEAWGGVEQKRMALVHQSAEMRRMLHLYGGTVVGMDATHKTSAYEGFYLYLITVTDNHGHGFPATLFITETDTSAMVEKCLRVIKEWNPGWSPKFVMIDHDAKEQSALLKVYEDTHQLQQQHVRPSALFVDGISPPRGSRAAAANHQAARKVSSRTRRPLQVYKPYKPMGVTKPRVPKPPDFPKRKNKEKQKPFESTAGMAAALHPPFRIREVQPGPKIV